MVVVVGVVVGGVVVIVVVVLPVLSVGCRFTLAEGSQGDYAHPYLKIGTIRCHHDVTLVRLACAVELASCCIISSPQEVMLCLHILGIRYKFVSDFVYHNDFRKTESARATL